MESRKFKVIISCDGDTRRFNIIAPSEERAFQWGEKQAVQFKLQDFKITTEPLG